MGHRPVFENNFLKAEFSDDIGIAMGTPFVVTAANAFIYRHERDIIELYSQYLALYKRVIVMKDVIHRGLK